MKIWKKLTVCALALTLALSTGLLFGCNKKDYNVIELNEVTHSIFYAPLYVAINNGYYEEGIGSSWLLMSAGANAFGRISEQISNQYTLIADALLNGAYIIAAMGPGDFTSTGHFIVIVGVNENNELMILDPYRKSNSKSYHYEDIASQIQNLWALSI